MKRVLLTQIAKKSRSLPNLNPAGTSAVKLPVWKSPTRSPGGDTWGWSLRGHGRRLELRLRIYHGCWRYAACLEASEMTP